MNYRWCCWLLCALSFSLVSCSPWRDRFIDGGIGSLTQSEVREKFGKPHQVRDPLLSDETTWIYRFAISESELDPSGIKTFGKQAGSLFGNKPGGPREKVFCYVYVLTFDKEGVLRAGEREECQLPKAPDPFQQELPGMN